MNILEIIENSGSLGITFDEIKKETKLQKNFIKRHLTRLRERGLIYQNWSERKWRLIAYRRTDEIPDNEKMRWCAT